MINIHLYPSSFIHETRILKEAKSIEKLNLFNRIELIGVGNKQLSKTEEISNTIQIHRIGCRREDLGLLQKIWETLRWSMVVYLRYYRAPVKCINCHSISTLLLGSLLKYSTGAILIYDTHELETETNGMRRLRKLATKLVERILINRVDFCIFVGNLIEEWYVKEYGLSNTIVVYNYPYFQNIEQTDYFRTIFSIPSTQPIFLYQGAIAPGRGIESLIAAFAEMPANAAIVVMGYGSLVNWLEAQTTQYKNIFYHPAVPPDRLLEYTSAADYGLSLIESTSLSYDYCMPNKLFEYLMAKKPVIVSPTQEQKNFVERFGVGEVAENTSPNAIKKAVFQLINRDQNLLAASLSHIREEISWETQEKRLADIYIKSMGLKPLSEETYN